MEKLYALLLAMTVFCVQGQDKPPTDTTKTTSEEQIIARRISVPPSPTAAALGKYGEFPVSNYSGTPSISIPLMTTTGRALSVPVTLNYHASGIKVQQMSSWVGLGWSLSAGGVITRTINGLADQGTAGLRGPQSEKTAIQNYINCVFNAGGNCDATYYTMLQRIADGFIDSEPDVYSFNFMGRSGKIVFDYDDVPQFIPYQKMLISFDKANSVFTVTDDMGIVYTFDQSEGSTNTSLSEGYGVSGGATAWYLSKIRSVHGEEILFTYGSESLSYDLNVTNTATYEANDFFECGNSVSYNTVTGNYTSEAKVLQKISTTTEDIFFELAQPSEIPCYENSPPWRVATPLKRIVRKDKAGNIKMGQEFWYNCFPNSGRRLRLDSVKVSGSDNVYLPPHVFTYTTTPNMPGWVNDHQDYWGYNNGKSTNNSSFLPAEPNTSLFNNKYVGLAGYDREPDATEVRAFSLQKITYPTRGHTDFDFEVNQYGFRGIAQNNGGNKNGAGIRIGKISSFDGTQLTGIKQFDYTLGSDPTVSSGSVITLPVFGYDSEYYVQDQSNPLLRKLCRRYERTSHPKNLLSETQGSQVGYREVSVSEGLTGENGKTVYKYTSPYDFNDTGSNLFPFAPLTDKDHKRGLLTEELAYAKDPAEFRLVRQVVNTYEFNEAANRSERRYIKVGIKRRSLGDSPNSSTANIYAVEPYDYLSEWVYLKNSNTSTYFNGSAVSQNMDYTYNPFNLQVKTITMPGSGNEVYRTTTTYPNEINLSLLTNRHMISLPVAMIKEVDNNLLYKEVHTYGEGITSFGDPSLVQTEVYPNGTETVAGRMTMNYTYDDYGNIIQTERNSTGVKTAYLWGHNNSRILCEAQNISYNDLETLFNAANLSRSEFNGGQITSDQKNRIRNFLLSLGNNRLGSFYVYDPVRGVTETFTSAGLLTSYSYDNFGRLRTVSDNQSQINDRFSYGYAAGTPVVATPSNLIYDTPRNSCNNTDGTNSVFRVFVTGIGTGASVEFSLDNISWVAANFGADGYQVSVPYDGGGNQSFYARPSDNPVGGVISGSLAKCAFSGGVAPPTVSISTTTLCNVTLTAANCAGTVNWSNNTTGNQITISSGISNTYSATCTVGSTTSAASSGLNVPTLPTGWSSVDIGGPTAGCTENNSTGTLTLLGNGTVSGTSDSFHAVSRSISGNDVTIIARISSMPSQPSDDGDRSGIMIRSSNAPNAKFYTLIQDANGNVGELKRENDGGNGALYSFKASPVNQTWIKVVKTSGSIKGYHSTDADPQANNAWDPDFNLTGTNPTLLDFGSSYLISFVTWGTANQTTFSNISITVNGTPITF